MTAPTRVGRYEIIRRLGKSMTDVYLARDTVENRQAALKLVKADADATTRMILEAERRGAQIQQQLRSLDPRVVEVYDYGDAEGYFFVAMQYVEGRSLAEVLERDKRMEPERAARIALDICVQLEKFHAFHADLDGPRGAVVHGDIKPSNIHLGPHETVRLLDFGIARALALDRDHTYHEFGSPSYCSPERLERSHVDAQSDLWSVGVTLYEMLAGMPPYQAENTQKLEKLIQSGRPPRALPAACPLPLRAIVTKALAPHPEHRYPSAAAFGDDLRAFLEGAPTAAERDSHEVWSVNPTVEAFQPPEEGGGRQWRIRGRLLHGAMMAGCFLFGMVVLLATVSVSRYWRADHEMRGRLDYTRRDLAQINVDWNEYQTLMGHFRVLGPLSPVRRLDEPLAEAYRKGAEAVIVGYRSSNDASLRSFDWARAQTFLERARSLDAGGRVAGELALVRGYGGLLRALDWKGTDRRELLALREKARADFSEAAYYLRLWPDPHLALARVYVYSMLDAERAMSEFRSAERLGYRLKPREIEQQGDAYRYRAYQKIREGDRNGAAWYAGMARRFYERIPGYGRADLRALEMRRYEAAARKPAQRRSRRWQ